MRCYTLIRTDIPLQHQITQACHSAIQAGAEFLDPNKIPFLITLAIKDKDDLLVAANHLDYKGIKYHMFFEPDNNMGHSSITTEPLSKDQAKALSNYPLWRGN
jgi:hypothetical protein